MIRKLSVLCCFSLLLGCSQNSENVNTGETLQSGPKPVVDANARPLADSAQAEAPAVGPMQNRDGAPVDPQMMLNKAFFMQHFVAALYSKPTNQNPNPKWTSPLKDAQSGQVVCGDCHTKADMSRLPIQESSPAIEKLHANKEFMVDLMTKWVARLNSGEFGAKMKLKGEVTCTTCHATDPRQ